MKERSLARMLGKSSARPTVYGRRTGRMKKCFGCLVGCGYDVDNQTQRTREKRQSRRWIDEYEEPPAVVDRACPKGGPGCGCGFPAVTEGS
ncbi:hypothetical protein [Prescottella equi]|uniref:hypothetical protein n=1 Tax=Rhodococcus hoagii TaxID=43767 RepID=UPI000D1008DC|nr:hypothetical protein [Prescottella equi]AVP71239.1 hypothetical protein C7H75_24435 [Prescottella equi]